MEKQNENTVIYFSHGGGPLPILNDPSHAAMVTFLQRLSKELQKPEAIIVLSAHWEESQPTIIGKGSSPLLYDYYGFPEQAYSLPYSISGNSILVDKIQAALHHNKISSHVEVQRGYDHGVFIPLLIMYPEGNIPVIQISLIKGLDPLQHILLGKALRNLSEENILFIGSGFSFHNMQAFTIGNWVNNSDKLNDAFQEWLIEVCTGNHTADEVMELLTSWENAPNARYCHPREEHLLPLHVCAGISSEPANLIFDDYIAGKRSIALQWIKS